ncbi:MAG: phospholipase D-like domain-containing protein [Candidatus Micrarchaeota archaeon]
MQATIIWQNPELAVKRPGENGTVFGAMDALFKRQPFGVDFIVGYTSPQGLGLIREPIKAHVERGNFFRLITGFDYGRGKDKVKAELETLQSGFGDNFALSFFEHPENRGNTFHPKLYAFHFKNEVIILCGSSNLTEGGLSQNHELMVSLKLNPSRQQDAVHLKEFEQILQFYSGNTYTFGQSSLFNWQNPNIEAEALFRVMESLFKANPVKVDFIVGNASHTGLEMIRELIFAHIDNGGKLNIITAFDYSSKRDQDERKLRDIQTSFPNKVEVRIFEHKLIDDSEKKSIFHPKAYVFHYPAEVVLFCGSSNLTKGGFSDNHEAMVQLNLNPKDMDNARQLRILERMFDYYSRSSRPISQNGENHRGHGNGGRFRRQTNGTRFKY